MRSSRAKYNIMAVSGKQMEPALNAWQDIDMRLLLADGDYLAINRRTENNAEEANGMEEAGQIYNNGATGEASFTFNKLQPHQAAFLLAYGLGHVISTADGSSGKLHTITPLAGDLGPGRSNPSFTAMQRLGLTITHRRLASCVVDGYTFSFPADDWISASGKILSTGKFEESVIEEKLTAAKDATTLTLGHALQGSTDAERLDSVQVVRAEIDGAWHFIDVTAAGAENPAKLTIEPPGGTGDTTYRVLYAPVAPAWTTLPPAVRETPLRLANTCFTIGGAWDGSAFVGGRRISADFRSFEYSLENNIAMEFTSCAGGDFAGNAFREGRNQKISLNRELRDMLLQRYLGAGEYFGLHVLCEGDEFETGQKYTLELIFPRLGLLGAPLSTDKKRIAEKGDLQVLEHPIYGSVIARVKNTVASFAA